MATALPLETQTLHAELLEHLLAVQARRSVGHLGGSFTSKEVKGEPYLYYQASQPGGSKRQFYLGRRTPALEALVRRFEREQAAIAPDLERVRRLCAQLRAGGANLTDGPSARVLRGLAEAGLFAAGGVVVGTHALAALGNLLGVRWTAGALRTQDVDVAGTHAPDVDVAVPDVDADLPAALHNLEMGFLPVPPLDPKQPSTSFKVRGQALRVDLLCPGRPGDEQPIFIKRFNAAAQPLPFLDLLLESPERAAIIDGGAALVNVPAPARFALHKLLIAPLRPLAFQDKAGKDLVQAAEVLEVLIDARPGDLALAWEAIERRGPRWRKAMLRGLAVLKQRQPQLYRQASPLLGRRRR
jgi:hypothetical protein